MTIKLNLELFSSSCIKIKIISRGCVKLKYMVETKVFQYNSAQIHNIIKIIKVNKKHME